jgi:hypothetical protein
MSSPIPTDPLERMADILRIGNRAARAAQEANRRRGIANWYSLNGRLVSDAGEQPPTMAVVKNKKASAG